VTTILHPERFDPRAGQRGLIDCEHHARYWWAAQAVAGHEVLDAACGTAYGSAILAAAGASRVVGVDLDPEALASVAPPGNVELIVGDVRKLPLGDDAFDVVVCFETIEHIEDGAAALREFSRVLRPDGVLLLSSPNRGVYPTGNQHHEHEYTADELATAAGGLFANVARWRQHAWVASTVDAMDGETPAIRHRGEIAPGEEIFTLVAASDGPLPELAGLAVVGDAFEVRWWQEQLDEATERQHELQHAYERERADHDATRARVQDAQRRLLGHEQELAKVPVLRERVRELEAQLGQVWHRIGEQRANYEDSISWRVTKPLRAAMQRVRR
jgi:SAM-dependent methyltransferase